MNHKSLGGCYTYAVTPIVVLDRRIVTPVGLFGRVVGQVLAFTLFDLFFFVLRHLTLRTQLLDASAP